MIRDPSDGSVREAPTGKRISELQDEARSEELEIITKGLDAVSKSVSGIRQPTKTDAMMRLEFSREWLKQYHAKKETAHADGGNNGTEHQADGRIGNDQGEAQSALSGGNGADSGTPRQG